MKTIVKQLFLNCIFGTSFFRKGVRMGKKSYIREHVKISGGRHITLGNNTRVYPYSRLECFEYVSGEVLLPCLKIGDNVFVGRNTTILCSDSITIGDNCLIASYCFISDENHGIDLSKGIRYEEQKLSKKPVRIGKNCWIGEKVIILPGVTIGDNVVIGAGSVVTKDIPNNVIAVGNPAEKIKKYNYNTRQWEKIVY